MWFKHDISTVALAPNECALQQIDYFIDLVDGVNVNTCFCLIFGERFEKNHFGG
jgi:hypothetical protein